MQFRSHSVVEITESALIADNEGAHATLAAGVAAFLARMEPVGVIGV